MKKKCSNKGFTLMELLLTVVIISILMTVIIPSFSSVLKKVRDTACEMQRKSLERRYNEFLLLNDSVDIEYADTAKAMSLFRQMVSESFNKTMDGNILEGLCPNGHKYHVEFSTAISYSIVCDVCGKTNASSNISVSTEVSKSVLESLIASDVGFKLQGVMLIEALYNALGGTLLKVEDELIDSIFKGAELYSGGGDLYWRPYLFSVNGERKFYMYASIGNDSAQSSWNGYIIAYNNKYYKSTKVSWNGKVDRAIVTLNGDFTTEQQVVDYITSHNFANVN